MKKNICCIYIVLILIFGSGIAHAQFITSTSIDKFVSSVQKFHKRLLSAGGHANLLATTPSTSNLVKFPHMSLGASAALVFDIHGFGKLLSNAEGAFAAVSPDNLFKHVPGMGMGTVATLRFGGGNVPFDIGLHAMYLPIKVSTGLSFSKLTVGGDFRYALLKDEDKKPGISIGLKYAYTLSKMEWFWNHMSFRSMVKNRPITITLQDPKVAFNFSDHVIGLPLQLSKLLGSFFEPYIGVEPFIIIGSLTFASNMKPTVKFNDEKAKAVDISTFVKNKGKIKSDIFNKEGLNYNHTIINGGVRLYGGFALKLWLFYLDIQGSYEPINNEFGLATGFRFQY